MTTAAGDGSTKTVTLLWTDFSDGSPHDSIDPHQITGILWLFHPLPAPADGGTDAGDASTDAPADAPSDVVAEGGMSTDANMSEVGIDDGGGDSDGGMSIDASSGPVYSGDVVIDDVELVPF